MGPSSEAVEIEQLRRDLADAHRTIRILTGSAAWFGAWQCGCSITERKPDRIAEFCPMHGRPLLSNAAGQTKVELNHSGVSGYGFHAGPKPADSESAARIAGGAS
jgi:hypothetical protein